MAVNPITQQTWDTTSYVNPTRMNNIENNIGILSKATGVEYSSGVSVKDKIDSILNWTLVGSQTGNTDISLPSTFNELVIFAHEANDYSISFTWHIINEELATTKRAFRQGYYLNSSNNGSIIASVSKTLATISSYAIGGTSYIERIVFEVYAR